MHSGTLTAICRRVVLGVFAVVALLAIAGAALAHVPMVPPQRAIADAVTERLGTGVSVAVVNLGTAVPPTPGLRALTDPAARVGQPGRFVLMAGRTRRGAAVATVTVVGPFVRAVRPIARDAVVREEDVERAHGEWPQVPLTPMPGIEEIVGRPARRAIAEGEVLTAALFGVQPLVRAGDIVTLTATVGAVHVAGEAIAGNSGRLGDVIRVTPRPNGRPRRGRVVGPAAIEVVH